MKKKNTKRTRADKDKPKKQQAATGNDHINASPLIPVGPIHAGIVERGNFMFNLPEETETIDGLLKRDGAQRKGNMENQDKLTVNGEIRREFLTQILESEENRRASLDSRSAILLAANAALLTGVVGFGVPLAMNGVASVWMWLKVSLAILALISAVVSVLIIVQIVAPLAIYQKEREKLMDLDLPEFNVYFFLKIADYKRRDFINAVNSLTENDIIEQLASEVHNVSRILQYRLPRLRRAHIAFVIGIIAFVLLALLNLI